MQSFDWFLLVVLGLSSLLGAWRGLIFELISVLSWVAAFFTAQWFAGDAGRHLPWVGEDSALSYAAGFAVVFIAVVFLFGLVARICQKMLEVMGLRPADRALGGMFGLLRGLVLLLSLAVLVGLTPLHQESWWKSSLLAPLLVRGLDVLKPILPEDFGHLLPLWG